MGALDHAAWHGRTHAGGSSDPRLRGRATPTPPTSPWGLSWVRPASTGRRRAGGAYAREKEQRTGSETADPRGPPLRPGVEIGRPLGASTAMSEDDMTRVAAVSSGPAARAALPCPHAPGKPTNRPTPFAPRASHVLAPERKRSTVRGHSVKSFLCKGRNPLPDRPGKSYESRHDGAARVRHTRRPVPSDARTGARPWCPPPTPLAILLHATHREWAASGWDGAVRPARLTVSHLHARVPPHPPTRGP